MSKSPLRKDKTCLNCKYVVEHRFCSNCGQENTETRKTFHHLFIHFFEDLTHYENAFWKTIRNLIFKPGSLTKEYLSGKRLSYLAPFRLYIFISFVTFLVVAMLPDEELITTKKSEDGITTTINGKEIEASANERIKDSVHGNVQLDLINGTATTAINDKTVVNFDKNFGFGSLKEFDSIQKYGSKEDRLPPWPAKMIRKALYILEHNTGTEIRQKFTESFGHNFPKVLFIYMPIFAFVLWIFQDKRRWYYFDHGIFTLHYFSFLLLSWLISCLLEWILGLFGDSDVSNVLLLVSNVVIIVYMLYYFFPAHHRFYEQSRGITIIKGILMFIINSILAGIIMLAFMAYTFLNIH